MAITCSRRSGIPSTNWSARIFFSPRGGREFSFEEFASFCRRIRTLQHFTARHFLGPKLYLSGRVDTFLRFETLQDDFDALARRLDIPAAPLPVRNKSERMPYRECYDAKLRRFVEDRHAHEIRVGGYSF